MFFSTDIKIKRNESKIGENEKVDETERRNG